jgi:hypothetical protein
LNAWRSMRRVARTVRSSARCSGGISGSWRRSRRRSSASNSCGHCWVATARSHPRSANLRCHRVPPPRVVTARGRAPGRHGMRRLGSPQQPGPRQRLRHRQRRQASPEAAIGRVLAASALRPIREPSGWSATMRTWRWGSAVRCVGRGPSMSCRQGWRSASTARPCSVRCAIRCKSSAARRAARYLRPGCLRRWGKTNIAPERGPS